MLEYALMAEMGHELALSNLAWLLRGPPAQGGAPTSTVLAPQLEAAAPLAARQLQEDRLRAVQPPAPAPAPPPYFDLAAPAPWSGGEQYRQVLAARLLERSAWLNDTGSMVELADMMLGSHGGLVFRPSAGLQASLGYTAREVAQEQHQPAPTNSSSTQTAAAPGSEPEAELPNTTAPDGGAASAAAGSGGGGGGELGEVLRVADSYEQQAPRGFWLWQREPGGERLLNESRVLLALELPGPSHLAQLITAGAFDWKPAKVRAIRQAALDHALRDIGWVLRRFSAVGGVHRGYFLAGGLGYSTAPSSATLCKHQYNAPSSTNYTFFLCAAFRR